jgi:hypothetical protein
MRRRHPARAVRSVLWFDHADAKGDGRVTLAEAEAHPLQLFDMADTNHDGVVDQQERKLATMMMSLTGK